MPATNSVDSRSRAAMAKGIISATARAASESRSGIALASASLNVFFFSCAKGRTQINTQIVYEIGVINFETYLKRCNENKQKRAKCVQQQQQQQH